MRKRYSQNENGLYTDAEAAVFIGCAYDQRANGKVLVGYAACVFVGGQLKTLTKVKGDRRVFREKIVLYDAVDLALDYCHQCGVSSADIIYDAEEELIHDLASVSADAPLTGLADIRKMVLKESYGSMDVRLYRENAQGIDQHKVISALRGNTNRSWIRNLDSTELFLVLAEELAKAVIENDSFVIEVENCIREAACLKKIVVNREGENRVNPIEEAMAEWERMQREFGELKIDDEDGDEGNADEEASDEEITEDKRDEKKHQGEDSRMEKTIVDLIFKYAESIKKEKMTSFHLVYGYACFCDMEVKDICRELGLGEEDYVKMSYAKNKIQSIFDADTVEIDIAKAKILIPQYIDELEKDEHAGEDYDAAMKIVSDWRELHEFSEEVVAYSLLHRLVSDTTSFNVSGLNNVYLKKNKHFLLEKKSLEVSGQYIDSLEVIAKKSTKLYEVLTKKINGQDFAIQKFVQGYINSKLAGQSKKDKPAASYLFAGPPGVGKTYLARMAAEALDMPVKIFDMSEYCDEHASDGLVGFEKTWKGSIPGVLTTYVSENPASIILVDEIEKAHLSVQLLFLQILEGARLYDKYYEKYISFENIIIIFTTNCGKGLYEDNEDTDLSTMDENEILESLREDQSFPNELCSRFASGNIIMFNHLKSYDLCDIVRSKMDEVTEDIAANYQVQASYDRLLPELFLFQFGSGIDARVASSQSAEFIKECVLSLVKDTMEKQGDFAVNHVTIDINLDKEDKDIYSLFVNESDSRILVISDSQKFAFRNSKIKILSAEDENEMIRVIRENKLSLVLIDLTYKAAEGSKDISNALGIESVGRNCLDVVREKAPQLPVYIVNQEFYHAEDKKAILNYGARGLFTEGENEKECARNVRKLVGQLYIQENLKRLVQKGQRVNYKTRYLRDGKYGVIELYKLSLVNVGMDDAALRRKAKKSKVFDFERPTIRFDDIIGAEQAKKDFRHFINYIHNTDKYVLEGAETPKGILLYGPPGTGKTSLAKALAGECDALFLNTTGANIRNAEDPIQEIKDLFKIAYTNAPAILFIDEIDVIAKERRGYDTGTEVLVNTLLTEMEGFSDKDPFKPVFVVAATNYNVEHRANRPDEIVIDPALVRRFDNPVYVGLPSREERKQYIQLMLEKKNYADKISEVAVDYVAEHTGGKSLAFLRRAISNMTNMAIDAGKEVNDDLLTDTLETQLYGQKRENDEEYRLNVARHEAGHAYVSWKTGREPKFITIVSRGQFGGYVSYGDGEDVHNLTKEDFLNYICQALAGRAAEIAYYGESGINTGASSDLEQATKYAIKMICYFGMGSLGLISIDPEHILDSPKGAEVLEEANRILEAQMERAVNYIKEGSLVIDRVVDALMDKSYVQGENLIAILEEGEQAAETSKEPVAKKRKWYVVINGRKPGIYTSWRECAEQVQGYSNAVYRSYETKETAEQAFQSSRIGVKNIRDKKLLYHLVKLSDVEQILQNGLLPDKQIAEKKYLSFDFHAYAPEAIRRQQENPEERYIYLCISREYAVKHGFQIYLEYAQADSRILDYGEGILRIDWQAMEQFEMAGKAQTVAECVTENELPYAEVQFIYTPDEESAAAVKALCQRAEGAKESHAVVSVNKRMFV